MGRLQARLNVAFPNYRATPLEIDEIFGPMTEAAVQEFQARVGIDADGIVGRSRAPSSPITASTSPRTRR
ncbi:MAG: peptidoglycan-binding protein [Actinomycetia bacterium]|nr:peptidoglycan-binding protein [Actinomycetes bacterium]